MLFDNLTIGILIIFSIIIIALLIGKPILLKAAISQLSGDIKTTFRIIVLTILIISLLSIPVILSSNVSASIRDYLELRTADANGIIHSKVNYYSQTEVNDIFLNSGSYFISYIPIRYEIGNYNNLNFVFTSFNIENSKSFLGVNEIPDGLKDLDADEAIVSKNLTSRFNFKVDDKVTFKIKDSNYTIKIKDIVEENGLFGFDLPLESASSIEKNGSIYVNDSFFGFADQKYNAILLKTKTSEYSKDTLEREVNYKIKSISSDLNFEEVRQTTIEKMVIGTSDISLSQIILFLSILIALPLILVVIKDLISSIRKRSELFWALQTNGIGEFTVIRIGIFKSAIIILLSIVPSILLNILIFFILKYIGINFINFNQDYYNILNFGSYLEGLSFAVIVLVLIFFMIVSATVSEFKENELQQFSFRKQSLQLFAIFIGILFLMYSFSGYPTNQNEKSLFLYLGFLLLVFSVLNIVGKIYLKRYDLIINLSLCTVFILTFAATFSGDFIQKSPFILLFLILNFVSLLLFFSVNHDHGLRNTARLLKLSKKNILHELRASKLYKINYYRFFRLSTIFLMTIIFAIINPASEFLKNEVSNSNYNFDLVVNDKLGDTFTSYGLKGADEVFAFGEVKFKDFTFGDIKKGLNNPQTIGKDSELFIDSISTINEKQFANVKLGGQDKISYEEFKREYIILGNNYLIEKSDDNIRPNLKVGDEIVIKFNDKLEVKRKVYAFIEDIIDAKSLIPTKNGIFISFDDYKNLQFNLNINLNTVYGFNFENDKELNKFVDSIRNLPLASITQSINNIEASKLTIDYAKTTSFFIVLLVALIFLLSAKFYNLTNFLYIHAQNILLSVYLYFTSTEIFRIFDIRISLKFDEAIMFLSAFVIFTIIIILVKNYYEKQKSPK